MSPVADPHAALDAALAEVSHHLNEGPQCHGLDYCEHVEAVRAALIAERQHHEAEVDGYRRLWEHERDARSADAKRSEELAAQWDEKHAAEVRALRDLVERAEEILKTLDEVPVLVEGAGKVGRLSLLRFGFDQRLDALRTAGAPTAGERGET